MSEPVRVVREDDLVDGDRSDLDAYLAMAGEFGARRVLDIGCGTGTLACLLAARGLEVTGADPALFAELADHAEVIAVDAGRLKRRSSAA